MEPLYNDTVMKTVDCDHLTMLLKPIWSKQAMFGIERNECSDFRTLKLLLTDFFWSLFTPKDIVVVVDSTIQVEVGFITEPDVIEPAGSLLKLVIEPFTHHYVLLLVLLFQYMVCRDFVREQLEVIRHDPQYCRRW